MPADEDKYPTETGRRRFVRGVVGSAALGTVSVGTAASVNLATSPTGAGGGTTRFIGIENTAGPAPRGLPLIPIEITGDGELRGIWPSTEQIQEGGRTVTVARQDLGGFTYSSTWFQYCGVQQYSGAQPTVDADNMFRVNPAGYDWTSTMEANTVLTVDDFSNYKEWGNGIGRSGLGKPAMANWRTTEEGRPLPVQILRSPDVSRMANGEGEFSDVPDNIRSFVSAATDQDFIAWLGKCTHFCCVPKFKGYAGSAKFGGEDEVYCPCHQSIYDPFSPVIKQFVALPRPED